MASYADERIAVSFPSLRVGTLTRELVEEVKKVRKTGFTLAPEAGSERLRSAINKGITEEDLLSNAFEAYSAGWRLIKLYFMIGLPGETREDVLAIADLAKKVKLEGRRSGQGGDVNVSVGTFVPKPHTPFQWEPQIGLDEIREKQQFLRQELRLRKTEAEVAGRAALFPGRGLRQGGPAAGQAAGEGPRTRLPLRRLGRALQLRHLAGSLCRHRHRSSLLPPPPRPR